MHLQNGVDINEKNYVSNYIYTDYYVYYLLDNVYSCILYSVGYKLLVYQHFV